MNAEKQIQAYEGLLEHLENELKKRCFRVEHRRLTDWFVNVAHESSPVVVDYYVARGWFDKMMMQLKAARYDEANAAGRNMLDAALRAFIRIGIDKAAVDDFLRVHGFNL